MANLAVPLVCLFLPFLVISVVTATLPDIAAHSALSLPVFVLPNTLTMAYSLVYLGLITPYRSRAGKVLQFKALAAFVKPISSPASFQVSRVTN